MLNIQRESGGGSGQFAKVVIGQYRGRVGLIEYDPRTETIRYRSNERVERVLQFVTEALELELEARINALEGDQINEPPHEW